MRVVFRHAWMQKHPSPSNQRGDFHWHPSGIPSAIRGTLTDLVTRERRQKASLWIIDGSYAAWARSFAALSPVDDRRYTGLAITIAQPKDSDPAGGEAEWSKSLPEVLARLPLAEAAPWTSATELEPQSCQLDSAPGANRPLAVDPGSLERLFRHGERNLARSLYRGGAVQSREPHAERLPALLGRLLSWLPPGERAEPRVGVLTDRPIASEARPSGEGIDNLLHYLTGVWFCPAAISRRWPGYAIDCWQLVFDLASRSTSPLAELFGDLTHLAQAWNRAEDLYNYLIDGGALSASQIAQCDARAPRPLYDRAVSDAGWLWNRLLHYWGRGFLPGELLPGLAGLLARRIAADHLFHLDAPDDTALPMRYLRRLRYEALLPRARVNAILDAMTSHLPSLSFDPEVQLV